MLMLYLIIAAGVEERGDPNDPCVRLKRDCVAILAAFRIIEAPSKLVLLGNTHLYWQVLLLQQQMQHYPFYFLLLAMIVTLDMG